MNTYFVETIKRPNHTNIILKLTNRNATISCRQDRSTEYNLFYRNLVFLYCISIVISYLKGSGDHRRFWLFCLYPFVFLPPAPQYCKIT